MASVSWKDKRLVILLFTHALPIDMLGEPKSYVPMRNDAMLELLHTTPMHLEYTTYKRRVDVADQLGASYSYQIQSHK